MFNSVDSIGIKNVDFLKILKSIKLSNSACFHILNHQFIAPKFEITTHMRIYIDF